SAVKLCPRCIGVALTLGAVVALQLASAFSSSAERDYWAESALAALSDDDPETKRLAAEYLARTRQRSSDREILASVPTASEHNAIALLNAATAVCQPNSPHTVVVLDLLTSESAGPGRTAASIDYLRECGNVDTILNRMSNASPSTFERLGEGIAASISERQMYRLQAMLDEVGPSRIVALLRLIYR